MFMSVCMCDFPSKYNLYNSSAIRGNRNCTVHLDLYNILLNIDSSIYLYIKHNNNKDNTNTVLYASVTCI